MREGSNQVVLGLIALTNPVSVAEALRVEPVHSWSMDWARYPCSSASLSCLDCTVPPRLCEMSDCAYLRGCACVFKPRCGRDKWSFPDVVYVRQNGPLDVHISDDSRECRMTWTDSATLINTTDGSSKRLDIQNP